MFAPLTHKHSILDLTDYTIDSELSETSNNPVINKVVNAEFEAIGDAMGSLELAIDGKADINHNHDDKYDPLGSAETALATSKEYTDNKVASMIFIGTYEEYQTAYANNEIPINTFVILTDDESSGGGTGGSGEEGDETSSTTAKLGYAVLGQMVLG